MRGRGSVEYVAGPTEADDVTVVVTSLGALTVTGQTGPLLSGTVTRDIAQVTSQEWRLTVGGKTTGHGTKYGAMHAAAKAAVAGR